MNRTRKIGIALVSLVALGSGGAWLVAARAPAGTHVETTASGTPTGFAWKRGTRYLYDFSWAVRSNSHVEITRGGVTDAAATSSLAGKLALKSYGPRGDGWLLGVTIDDLRENKLLAMGADLFSSPDVVKSTFDQREAFVEVGSDGRVRQLRFRAADPPLFKQLVQSLVEDMQVVLAGPGGGAAWSSSDVLSVGTIETAYTVDAADPLLLHRTPTRAASLTALPPGAAGGRVASVTGSADVHLDRAGFVRSLTSTLDVNLPAALEHHAELALTFESTSEFDAPASFELAAGTTESIAPGARPAAPELRARMDERFAARTSMPEITRMIDAYGTGLQPERGMLNATAAFLRLHPEACSDLAGRFLDPELAPKGREFMMGLLASAGSPAAQTAMRSALDEPESRRDAPSFGRMVQRLGFVAGPTKDSIDYLVALASDSAITGNADLKRATALTLGAMSNHAQSANKPLSDAIHAGLVADMTAAKGDEKVGLVAAVGNAARPADVPLLRKVAKDGAPPVREAVARAMRGIDSPETRGALRDLLGDEDTSVVRAAAQAYGARPLASEDMTALATMVRDGSLSAGGDGAVLALVQGHMEHTEPSEQILEALLARHPDGADSGKIRLLLRRLRG